MRRLIVTLGVFGMLAGLAGCVVHERRPGYGYYHHDHWRAERHYDHRHW